VSSYVHGYATPEQERLVQQADHWREALICAGTELPAGTRLLEVGCGVGAVLAVLGQEYPGVRLTGIDIEPAQLEFARGHLARALVKADLHVADATALPFPPASFDHVWMMWFLEHLSDPLLALREAKRVLAPGGAITAIEVDYATCRAEPSTAGIETLFAATVEAMAAAGWSDAGTRLPGWLRDAGFTDVQEGEHRFWWEEGEVLARQARYAADVMESALQGLIAQGAGEDELRRGLADLRELAGRPGSGLGWVVHKSTGQVPGGSETSTRPSPELRQSLVLPDRALRALRPLAQRPGLTAPARRNPAPQPSAHVGPLAVEDGVDRRVA
jgi:SAM-dependent methyltransferase